MFPLAAASWQALRPIQEPFPFLGRSEFPPSAVSNAVYHAAGVRVRELPIRLEKLLIT
jgi:CO/xanthine dehydrogenase Mo-binding subunit